MRKRIEASKHQQQSGSVSKQLEIEENMVGCRKSPNTTNITSLQSLFDTDSPKHTQNYSNNNKLRFGDNNNDSEYEEMISLIDYCSFTYYTRYTDPVAQLESPSLQDLKRLKLIQLFSIIRVHKKPLLPLILPPLFTMLSANLFRPLPPPNNLSSSAVSILPDDDDFILNPAKTWSHLQILYDILLRLIIITDVDQLRGFIDHSFILNLVALFQSDDPRERESLKSVFHRVYSKFTSYRSFMRKAMNDVILRYVFECKEQRHPGIGDLLEIWGTIINGFSVPLKEEHKIFFERVLIPLHRPKGMQSYHKQLAYCVFQFVHKDAELAAVVVRGILKYWPLTNCHKEVLFIGELEELVETIQPSQYSSMALPLCTQITKCSNSWNSQVAERALYMWNSEKFWRMAVESMEQVFPVVVRGMENNLKGHWSRSVKELTENVKGMLQGLDPCLYTKCLTHLQIQQSLLHQQEMTRRRDWERIEEKAAANTKFGKTLPSPHIWCLTRS